MLRNTLRTGRRTARPPPLRLLDTPRVPPSAEQFLKVTSPDLTPTPSPSPTATHTTYTTISEIETEYNPGSETEPKPMGEAKPKRERRVFRGVGEMDPDYAFPKPPRQQKSNEAQVPAFMRRPHFPLCTNPGVRTKDLELKYIRRQAQQQPKDIDEK